MKLQDIVIFNPTERLPTGGQVPFVDMAALPQMGRDIHEFIERQPASSGARFKNGDTLMARITPCLENGKGAQVRSLPSSTVGQGSTEFIVLRAKQPSDTDFVYYISRHPDFRSHAIQQMTGTSGRQRVAWQSLADYELPDIEPAKRASIGSILGALDDKIELNRRMNETLEAMARAIFKDWFVDFGPTRAKMEGRPPYLAPDIWSLFPDRLDDEGKPEGWRTDELGNVTSELRRGLSPTYTDVGGVSVLNQKCIRNGQVNFAQARRHDPSKRTVDGRQLIAGDILVNSTGVGTLGRVAQIWDFDEPTIVDSHVTVVRADVDNVGLSYLGINLTGRETEIEALGEGSTGQTELARSRLAQLPILVPSGTMQHAFEDAVHPLLNRVTSNSRENLTLAATRDYLLPKLMSGEIRVKDAEQLISEAV